MFRKARATGKRYDAAFFFFLAVYFSNFLLAIHLSRSFKAFLDKVGTMGLSLGFVVVGSLIILGSVAWARHVPTRVSIILAVIAWVILLFLVYYFEWLPALRRATYFRRRNERLRRTPSWPRIHLPQPCGLTTV
jgi:hypothetical protein